MPTTIEAYYHPKTLSEALSLLGENKGALTPLAGGTSITISKKKGAGVVDLQALGLDRIQEVEGKLEIGAMVKISSLFDDRLIHKYANGVIIKACRQLASTPLRNLITVGGNIVQLHPWSDLPPLFLSLGSTLKLRTARNERFVKADDFFAANPKSFLKSGEIVESVILPIRPSGEIVQFTKFTQNHFDYSLATVVSALQFNNKGEFSGSNINIGAVSMRPQRLKDVEEFILNKTFSEELILQAGIKATETVNPMKTFRASVEYLKELVGKLLIQQLKTAYLRYQKEKK